MRQSHGVPPTFDAAMAEAFWGKWDKLAQKRKEALAQRPVDWEVAKQTMMEANLLLQDAPDQKLRRLARLTRLPLDYDLDNEDRIIYVLWGPFPCYVGQTGCITGERSPFARYIEHVRKAKSLRNHFTSKRFRRVQGLLGFGKCQASRDC